MGVYLGKLQGSCKQAQNITITTLWAATTTNCHTENLCEKIIVNTYQWT